MRVLLGVVVLLALAGCGQQQGTSAPTTSPSSTGSHRAWDKPYADTTCGDFEHRMSPDQRYRLVADALAALRARGGAHAVPAAVVVHGFEAAVHDSCAAVPASYGVADVALGVYRTEQAHWRP